MNVLVVDDHEDNRYFLETLLTGSGYTVCFAMNGEEALEILEVRKIDLIICDILMPAMDGFELCRRVKTDDRLKAIPCIIYTATYTEPEDEDFALKIGADRFIIKPCEPDLFLKAVQEVTSNTPSGKGLEEPAVADEKELFKRYNERLVRKLEQKKEKVEQELQARKEAEEELRRLKEELEKQVAQRTEELQEKVNKLDKSQRAMLYMVEDLNEITAELKSGRRKLEAANRELQAFSYSVSHDLRAPLRAIDGFSRIIEEEYSGVLDKEGIRLLGVVRDNTKKMDILITDMLELSRTGRTEMRISEVDMTGMVHSIYHEIASREVINSFEFVVSQLPRASADLSLMKRVWSNLISNAVKYTMPKEKRRIVINGYREKGSCIYSIRDSGVGFNPEYKDKLFSLFQRLHKAEEFEGSGVGLAIVARVIQRHGGEVWAEGTEGEGAFFSFSLPEINGGME